MARTMKDSGIAWVGQIPMEWSIEPMNKHFRFYKGLPITKADLIDAGLPVLSYGQIHSKRNDPLHIREELIRYVGDDYSSYSISLAHRNDVLFADTSEDSDGIGNHTYVDLENGIYAGYHTILAKSVTSNDSRYFSLLFQTDCWRSQLRSVASGIKVFSITKKMLDGVSLLLPPHDEQSRIADYLDEKCAKIDAIIDTQKSIIEKLAEYRLSVITEAVTKGLNPDVEMMDSGIEWIGKIPAHWKVYISRFAIEKIADIDHYMPPTVKNGIPYIMIGDLKEYASQIEFHTCKQIAQSDYSELCRKIVPQIGDIIFARYATIGTLCYVDIDYKFLVSYACVIIRANQKVLIGKYLMYYLKSTSFLEEAKQYTNANTQGNIGIEALFRIKIPIPPLSEQQEIAAYLDKKCAAIDEAVSTRQSMITGLTEYKKSLVYEVVTGKKEV